MGEEKRGVSENDLRKKRVHEREARCVSRATMLATLRLESQNKYGRVMAAECRKPQQVHGADIRFPATSPRTNALPPDAGQQKARD